MKRRYLFTAWLMDRSGEPCGVGISEEFTLLHRHDDFVKARIQATTQAYKRAARFLEPSRHQMIWVEKIMVQKEEGAVGTTWGPNILLSTSVEG